MDLLYIIFFTLFSLSSIYEIGPNFAQLLFMMLISNGAINIVKKYIYSQIYSYWSFSSKNKPMKSSKGLID